MQRRPKTASASPRAWLKTPDAAAYCGVSAGLLKKLRMRRPDDPQGAGPAYRKLSANLVIYSIDELDRWIEARALACVSSSSSQPQAAA